MASTIAELREMNEDDLVRIHDELAGMVQPRPQDYRNELYRREQMLLSKAMLNYTRWITAMTGVVTIATIVNVALNVI